MPSGRQVRLRYHRHNRKFSIGLKVQIHGKVAASCPGSQTSVLGLIDKDSLALRRYRGLAPAILPFIRENEMISIVTSNAAAYSVTQDRCRGQRRPGPVAGAGPQAQQKSKQYRRRQIDPTTCERDYRQDELDFMRAMDDYKCSSGRMFPTCSEVLEVVRSMGYVRLSAEQRELLGETLEHHTEPFACGDDAADDFDFDLDPEQ
jgi:hypothetical protein